MKISKDYLLKSVAGNIVVVPVGDKALDFNAIIHLNEVGSFIFKLLQENDLNKDEIVSKLLDEYEIDKETATKDVEAFLCKLKENKILEN